MHTGTLDFLTMDSMDTVAIVPPGDGTFGSMGDFQIVGLPFGDSTVHSVYVSPCMQLLPDRYYFETIRCQQMAISQWERCLSMKIYPIYPHKIPTIIWSWLHLLLI